MTMITQVWLISLLAWCCLCLWCPIVSCFTRVSFVKIAWFPKNIFQKLSKTSHWLKSCCVCVCVCVGLGSGAAGSWWALKELTANRCSLISHAENGHAALKFLLANTSARRFLGLDTCFFYWKVLNQFGMKPWMCWPSFLMLWGLQWLPTNHLRIYGDMLHRDRLALPRDISLYDIGFPCQPFSMLHNQTRLMQEPQAEVFREAMRTIYSMKPLICVLENVLGVLRVWETMEKYLKKHHEYFFCRLIIDPVKLGDCVRRRRVYILMIHKLLSGIKSLMIFWLFDFDVGSRGEIFTGTWYRVTIKKLSVVVVFSFHNVKQTKDSAERLHNLQHKVAKSCWNNPAGFGNFCHTITDTHLKQWRNVGDFLKTRTVVT